jgi:hypothetical protein
MVEYILKSCLMGEDTGKMISVFGEALYAVFGTGARFCRLFLFSTLGGYSRFWAGNLWDGQVELAEMRMIDFEGYKNLYTSRGQIKG